MSSDPTSLDRLHDLVVPPPVPLWPPAPGWYYVIVLVLLLLIVLAVRGFIHWQRNRYRREALAEFARQEPRLGNAAQRAATLAALAVLLKRTAITAYSRVRVAALTGPDWFVFLDRTGRTIAFSSGDGAKLAAAVYDPASASALDEATVRKLAASVRHWIKHHGPGIEQSSHGTGRATGPGLAADSNGKHAKDAESDPPAPASLPLRPSVQKGSG